MFGPSLRETEMDGLFKTLAPWAAKVRVTRDEATLERCGCWWLLEGGFIGKIMWNMYRKRHESWAKGPWKGFPLRKPLGMQLTVSAKVFFWNGESIFFWRKFWRKFMYTCLNCIVDICTLCLLRIYVSFCKNYWGIFRESLAKVLLKPWRKTTFIWRLGGLNCGLVVSELTDEGEQGPTS